MPTSLSDLVHNLSDTNKKESKTCIEKKLNLNVILLDLKIIDEITNARNAEKYALSQ